MMRRKEFAGGELLPRGDGKCPRPGSDRGNPSSETVKRTERCMPVVVPTAVMVIKEVWIRSGREEVGVFHWPYDHAGRKLQLRVTWKKF